MFQTEAQFIAWLEKLASRKSPQLRLGIGDDAALIRVRGDHELILTADLSIEGVHFIKGLHPPRSIGHRALARSLSDIAAMGGVPRFALVSVALPRGTARAWIEGFFQGLLDLAARFGVTLIGGDTAIVPQTMTVDAVVTGEVPRGKDLRRRGARPGDHIFVSGRLGQSALGLQLLKSGHGGKARSRPSALDGSGLDALNAHLYPEPRCKLGAFLRRRNLASSLMDISDGLSTDLARLCRASGVGAEILAERVPCPEGCNTEKALDLALNGGEDYELLFTVAPRKVSQVPASFRGVPLRAIGQISRSKNLVLVRLDGATTPLVAHGYDHFTKR